MHRKNFIRTMFGAAMSVIAPIPNAIKNIASPTGSAAASLTSGTITAPDIKNAFYFFKEAVTHLAKVNEQLLEVKSTLSGSPGIIECVQAAEQYTAYSDLVETSNKYLNLIKENHKIITQPQILSRLLQDIETGQLHDGFNISRPGNSYNINCFLDKNGNLKRGGIFENVEKFEDLLNKEDLIQKLEEMKISVKKNNRYIKSAVKKVFGSEFRFGSYEIHDFLIENVVKTLNDNNAKLEITPAFETGSGIRVKFNKSPFGHEDDLQESINEVKKLFNDVNKIEGLNGEPLFRVIARKDDILLKMDFENRSAVSFIESISKMQNGPSHRGFFETPDTGFTQSERAKANKNDIIKDILQIENTGI